MSPPRSSDTDACPGALRLHAAADGMLARVRLPGGMLSGAQLHSLRELADEFGDGHLELTSRANLQLRALKPGDAPALAARLRAVGLLPSHTHDGVRNIASPPLAGAATRALVRRLDVAVQDDPVLAGLPGKFLFAIGHVPLAADVAAVPAAEPGITAGPGTAGSRDATAASGVTAGPGAADGLDATAASGVTGRPGAADGLPRAGLFTVRFGGQDTGVRIGFDGVVGVLIAAAHAFLAEREAQRRGGAAAWRLRELADGPARVSARVVAALGLARGPVAITERVGSPDPGDPIGLVTQPDGLAAVSALVPLGRLGGVPSRVLEEADHLVVTPWRGMVVTDLPPEAAPRWADRLAAAGLAVAPGSPWSGVTACAGRPGCAKSLADVRADAAAEARFVDGLPVHWVGCARACGSPAGPHVRAEAIHDGYRITHRPAADPATGRAAQPGSPVGRGPESPARPVTVGNRPDVSVTVGEYGLVGPSTRGPGSHRIGESGAGTAAGPGTGGLGDVVAVARRA